MTEGRSARSQPLLVYGTSRLVTKTKRSFRHLRNSPCELAAGWGCRRLAQEPGQARGEMGPVLNERAVLEGLAPPADGDGAQEEKFEAGRKGGIALVDGILVVAQA